MRKVGSFTARAPQPLFPTTASAWRVRLVLAVAVALAPALAGTAGCGASHEQLPQITEIQPTSAYNDVGVDIHLIGHGFRPPLNVNTQSGAAGVEPSPFQIFVTPVDASSAQETFEAVKEQWRTDYQIDAGLPPGLPTGQYRVGLRDARGNQVISEVLFTSLGPDNDPPRITFLHPRAGTTVAPDSWVTVVAQIDDGQGQTRDHRKVKEGNWCARSPTLGCTPGVCIIEPSGNTCRFLFMAPLAPTPIEQIEVELEVVDWVLNRATAVLPVQVAWRPEIESVIPDIGPTSGGTEIVVRGKQLIDGLSRVLVDGRPIGGYIQDGAIHAVTQPHAPGPGLVALGNGDSPSAPRRFTFVAAPAIKVIDPQHAPAGETVRITVAGDYFSDKTTFSWIQGDVEHPIEPGNDGSPPPYATFMNEHRCFITLPPGTGVISLRAHDDIGGDSLLPDAFTFDPAP